MTTTGSGDDARPRLLVTGAAGRLGSSVAAHLHAVGRRVMGTDVVDADDPPWRFVRADLRDHQRVLDLLDGIDAVVHLGNHAGIGPTPPQVVFNDNVTINQNVFQGAAEQGVAKVVFASTLQLVGTHADDRTVLTPARPPTYPFDERMVPDPSNVYALSKQVSEVMLRYYGERCGLQAVAVRFPLLHQGEERFRVATGEERPIDVLEGFTGMTRDSAARLVDAILAADLPGFRVYQPGSAHRHRDLSIAQLVHRHYPGVDPGVEDLVDTSTITAETGWRPDRTWPA